MSSRLCSLFLAISLPFTCFAQSLSVSDTSLFETVLPHTTLRFSLLAPQFRIEHRLSEIATINVALSSGLVYSATSIEGQTISSVYLIPTLVLAPRFYLSQAERKSQGKRTDFFSGPYVGLPMGLVLNDQIFYGSFTLGFQRTLGRRAYWNVAIGPTAARVYADLEVTVSGNFELGFILNPTRLKKRAPIAETH